jgi:hypothetical protein
MFTTALSWAARFAVQGLRVLAMMSGASWNDRGLSPELYDAAREAARRAGVSVEEWLDSTFGSRQSAPGRPAQSPSRAAAPLTDTVASSMPGSSN